ncbi:MAG: sugar ABC transporter ATP-binding protein [Ignavibacteriae bacterium]|nr:sugar ABC transporter ATP-binding protein [Ignavibacteriota bacterium]
MSPLLEMCGIAKEYPGVRALADVTFELRAGEIHCLVGENGAGKSTLMKILAGALAKDAGSIVVNGQNVALHSPTDAQAAGIGIIYQDYKLVPELSVAENIFLGQEPTKQHSPFIDKKKMHDDARKLLAQLGEEIPTDLTIAMLSVAQRQMVEVAKALSRHVTILAMDEPTASLTEHETVNLFRVIRQLKSEGVGIIYISHRLEEVFEIGDRVTVLRDGKVVLTTEVAQVDKRRLIQSMVGRELEDEFPRAELTRGEEILRVEHLHAHRLHDINLTLYKGEILGIAGLVGAGRTELARVIFGADKKSSGRVVLEGTEISPDSPTDAIRAGIGLLTEDRNQLGLILQMNVRENISLASLSDLLAGPFISRGKEEALAARYVSELNIRPHDSSMEVEKLSGGNRQKVVLARWLSTDAKVLMFDEPTAGVDVGAKYEIYTSINRLAQHGIGVLVISSDLPELLGICNRIAVMCEGRVTGVLSRDEATQEKIMTLATMMN